MIRLERVSFGYDGRTEVFRDLSLQIPTGETVAVMGSNGSGKTTLLKLITGLLDPTAGEIDLAANGSTTFGFAPEDPDDALFAASVNEEVAFFPRNRGLQVDRHVEAALSTMGIEDLADRVPQTLSQGQKRLVSLAAVLSGDPAVVALDEPTSGLDAAGIERLGDALSELDRTVMMATHDSEFAWRHADRVIVLQDGGVRASGETRSVLGPEGIDFEAAGLRVPGPVRWARLRGISEPPTTAAEAAELLERERQ